MPVWSIPARDYEMPRNIALVDTNVLVAMFDKNDARCSDATVAIDLGQFRWAVSHAAIIEAWNFLVGKVKRFDFAVSMMEWIMTPGNVILVDDVAESIGNAHRYSVNYKLDIVDASIIDLADRMTRSFSLKPFVHVATYDARDFLRVFGRPDLSFHVYDMRDLSSTTGADIDGEP